MKTLTEDDFENYDSEEREAYLDSLYRPKKRNSRKQMLSMFVYHILVRNTNPYKTMSQKEIIDMLYRMPYELTVERKALSRVIHGLEDEMIGIHSNPKGGAWYDEDDDEFGLADIIKHKRKAWYTASNKVEDINYGYRCS